MKYRAILGAFSFISLVITVFLNTNCALLKEPNFSLSCLSEAEVKSKQNQYVDTDFKTYFLKNSIQDSNWKLLKDDCSKKYYNYGQEIFVLIFRNPETQEVNGIFRNKPFETASKECLDTALKQIEVLDLTWSKDLIKKAQDKYGPRWQDYTVGPAAVLECKSQKLNTPTYFSSLAGFVHVLSLDASRNCFYDAKKNKSDCSLLDYRNEIVSTLSERNEGEFKNTNLSIRTLMHEWQKKAVYILKQTSRPVTLFDDLQGYTLELDLNNKYTENNLSGAKPVYLSLHAFFASYDLIKRLSQILRASDNGFDKRPIGIEMAFLLEEGKKSADLHFQGCSKASNKRFAHCTHYELWSDIQ